MHGFYKNLRYKKFEFFSTIMKVIITRYNLNILSYTSIVNSLRQIKLNNYIIKMIFFFSLVTYFTI